MSSKSNNINAMNIINQNGNTVRQSDEKIEFNGKEYDIPSHVRSKNGNSLSMLNGRIYINGYRFDPKTEKWTLSITQKYGWLMELLLYLALGAVFVYGILSILKDVS